MEDENTTRKPEDSAFKQQRLPAWQPILTPRWVIAIFMLIGIAFIPIGAVLKTESDEVIEYKVQYDGSGADSSLGCEITEADAGTECTISFTTTEEMKSPIYVYYQLSNFYQNHRRYVKSRSDDQLRGEVFTSTSGLGDCDPLKSDGNLTLSPCGLIANSMFNDVITLDSSSYNMTEDGIAWKSDIDHKFDQPDGFTYSEVSSCGSSSDCYCDTGEIYGYDTEVGQCYTYSYPDDDVIKYLYESYSSVVNPIDGVKNEHFIVWMRTAGLPEFRKLYGKIHHKIPSGTTLEFKVVNNFLVESFGGKKWLVISTTAWFGGKNAFLGISYITVGSICLAIGLSFFIKQMFWPRKLGDTRFLVWRE